jgi:hypothetical protein|tara:strand:- start:48 stop:224 length:177 start_codon:yes stop_codon:yes gene_type:complete
MAKKLTKTKVTAKVKGIIRNINDMFRDKIDYSDSKVPMAAKKLLDLTLEMQRAERRIK